MQYAARPIASAHSNATNARWNLKGSASQKLVQKADAWEQMEPAALCPNSNRDREILTHGDPRESASFWQSGLTANRNIIRLQSTTRGKLTVIPQRFGAIIRGTGGSTESPGICNKSWPCYEACL